MLFVSVKFFTVPKLSMTSGAEQAPTEEQIARIKELSDEFLNQFERRRGSLTLGDKDRVNELSKSLPRLLCLGKEEMDRVCRVLSLFRGLAITVTYAHEYLDLFDWLLEDFFSRDWTGEERDALAVLFSSNNFCVEFVRTRLARVVVSTRLGDETQKLMQLREVFNEQAFVDELSNEEVFERLMLELLGNAYQETNGFDGAVAILKFCYLKKLTFTVKEQLISSVYGFAVRIDVERVDNENMAAQRDVRRDFIHLERNDVGQGAVATVDDALVKSSGHFCEGHGLAADAAFLGKVGVERDVGHAHAQALDVVDALHFMLCVEVSEAEREGIEHAQTGLFREALVDELEGLAGHGAMGVLIAVKEHGRFEHAHGRLQGRGLGACGTHLDDALAGIGDVGVFLAQHAVGEHLHLVLAVGQPFQVFAKAVHGNGLGLALGFHAGNLDDCGAFGRSGMEACHAEHEGADEKQNLKAFHHSLQRKVRLSAFCRHEGKSRALRAICAM